MVMGITNTCVSTSGNNMQTLTNVINHTGDTINTGDKVWLDSGDTLVLGYDLTSRTSVSSSNYVLSVPAQDSKCILLDGGIYELTQNSPHGVGNKLLEIADSELSDNYKVTYYNSITSNKHYTAVEVSNKIIILKKNQEYIVVDTGVNYIIGGSFDFTNNTLEYYQTVSSVGIVYQLNLETGESNQLYTTANIPNDITPKLVKISDSTYVMSSNEGNYYICTVSEGVLTSGPAQAITNKRGSSNIYLHYITPDKKYILASSTLNLTSFNITNDEQYFHLLSYDVASGTLSDIFETDINNDYRKYFISGTYSRLFVEEHTYGIEFLAAIAKGGNDSVSTFSYQTSTSWVSYPNKYFYFGEAFSNIKSAPIYYPGLVGFTSASSQEYISSVWQSIASQYCIHNFNAATTNSLQGKVLETVRNKQDTSCIVLKF